LRALPFTKIIVHCFLDVGGQTYSYDNNGIHADPKPDAWRTQCVSINCGDNCFDEDAAKKKINDDKSSGKWDGDDYRFFKHNYSGPRKLDHDLGSNPW